MQFIQRKTAAENEEVIKCQSIAHTHTNRNKHKKANKNHCQLQFISHAAFNLHVIYHAWLAQDNGAVRARVRPLQASGLSEKPKKLTSLQSVSCLLFAKLVFLPLCASAFRVWGSFRFASLQRRPFGLICLMIILFNKSLATGNHSFHCTTRRTVNAEATARRNRCERIAARNVRGHCCRRPMTDGWSLPRKRGYNNAANKTPTTAARPVHFLHPTLSRATVQSSIYQWGFFFLTSIV